MGRRQVERRDEAAQPTASWAGLKVGAVLGLLTLTLLAYGRLYTSQFVNFDDPAYVLDNPQVQAGLSREGLAWAFTTTHASNWHPLTWLSLQLDAQVYGLAPLGYHLTNLLLHAANVVLLFGVLCRMTGALWPSTLVAALFAVHPLHVESVAWVAERKDVLSTLFGLLTLAAYVRYAERPGWWRFLPVPAAFGLSLLAKPMLVTLPFVLLLLDYWPLRRWGTVSIRRLVGEKLPLIGLAVASSVVTLLAQQQGDAVRSLEAFPFWARLENAVLACVLYLIKTVWPVYLGVFYPHARQTLPLGPVVAAGLLLLGVTAVVVREARRRPYLLVGWFWYLGTLMPVLGLVQAGSQALADRYTYVPLIGVFVMAAWGLEELRGRVRVVRVLEGLALAACTALTWVQVGYWQDSVHLWEHTLDVAPLKEGTPDNYLAHWNLADAFLRESNGKAALPHLLASLRQRPDPFRHVTTGNVLLRLGRLDEAADQFRQALALNPAHAEAYVNLGSVRARQGRLDEALGLYTQALRYDPALAVAHRNLGWTYLRTGDWEKAAEHLGTAVRLDPTDAEVFHDLGQACLYRGQLGAAVENYRTAVRLAPEVARFHQNLAGALQDLGQTEEAKVEFGRALRLAPDWPRTTAAQAWQFATRPDPRAPQSRRALQLARQACQATGFTEPAFLDVLAAAYAEGRQFPEAVETARRALRLAEAARQDSLAGQIREHLAFYESQRPYRQTDR